MTYSIYTLSDPRDGLVRYVGVSKDPQRRQKEHMQSYAHGSAAKRSWIAELTDLKITPVLMLIDSAEGWKQAAHLERYWISYYRAHGVSLLNRRCLLFLPAERLYQHIQMTRTASWDDAKTTIENLARCLIQGRYTDIPVKDLATLEVMIASIASACHSPASMTEAMYLEAREYGRQIR